MSGIYIPNMEMPKENEAITIYCSGDAHRFYVGLRETIQKSKAIEVPDHGRLIDGDKLANSFREDADAGWNRFSCPANWSDAFDDVANMVDDEPTIIPASKEVK